MPSFYFRQGDNFGGKPLGTIQTQKQTKQKPEFINSTQSKQNHN